MILAKDVEVSMDSQKTGLNNNVLVVGGSGSGKTMSIVEPRLLTAENTNLIVTVSKRRLIKQYKPLLEKRGYTVYDMNLIQPEYADVVYDPLAFVKSTADIRHLATSVVDTISNPKSHADPFWDESAKVLLAAEIMYLRRTKTGLTIADVLDFHESIAETSQDDEKKADMNQKFESVSALAPKSSQHLLNGWKMYNALPPVTRGCVYGTLSAALHAVFSDEILKLMKSRKPKLDLQQFTKKKVVLFISTSAVNSNLYNFINLFYADAFKGLFEIAEKREDGRLPIPVQIICDDFAVGGTIPHMHEYMSVIRELQISTILLLQSETQLTNMYSAHETTGIINNCDTYVYLGGMDLDTADHMSQKINKPMDDILWMPVSKVVVCRRGQKPIVSSRYDIREMELYKEVKRNYDQLVYGAKQEIHSLAG